MGNRNLSMGSKGPDVKAIQEALNVWGASPTLKADGDFGGNTDTAVRQFQEKHGLDVDGTVGRQTRNALFPVGVATVTLYGMRLRMPDPPTLKQLNGPSFQLPQLRLGPPPPQLFAGSFTTSLYEPVRFPGLFINLPAPRIPNWNPPIPSVPGAPPSRFLGFVYDHAELQPGGQTTFQFNGARQDLFVLTMQNVYLRGPDDGAHIEADFGVQIGTPVTSPNGPWTVNPFVQITDVDRFGTLGAFHFWQPYAQAGFQFTGMGNPQPTLTANIFPVNLGLDLGNYLTVNVAGGLALTMDLGTGRVQAGLQLTTGLTLKFGKPNSPF